MNEWDGIDRDIKEGYVGPNVVVIGADVAEHLKTALDAWRKSPEGQAWTQQSGMSIIKAVSSPDREIAVLRRRIEALEARLVELEAQNDSSR